MSDNIIHRGKDALWNILVIVVAGMILAMLGILGTSVYNGAIITTQKNKASDQVILGQVSKNTALLQHVMSDLDAYRMHGTVDGLIVEVEEEPAPSISPVKRLVNTILLKPLWKSEPEEAEEVLAPTELEEESVASIQFDLEQQISETAIELGQ